LQHLFIPEDLMPSLVHQGLHAASTTVQHIADALTVHLDFQWGTGILVCTGSQALDPRNSVPDALIRVDDLTVTGIAATSVP